MAKEFSRDVWNATQRANHLQRESAKRTQEVVVIKARKAHQDAADAAAAKVASLIDLAKW